jgi:hypothetical protein
LVGILNYPLGSSQYCRLGREKSEEQSVNKQVGLSQKYVINFLHKYKEAGCKSVLHSILQPSISKAKRDMFTELYKEENKKLLSLEELCKTADTVTFKMSEEEAVQLEKETIEQSKSTKWFEVMNGRITASNLKKRSVQNLFGKACQISHYKNLLSITSVLKRNNLWM